MSLSRNLLRHARPFALRLLTKLNPKRCLTMSSVSGPLEPPLSTKTLPEFFSEEILQKHSGRRALISRKEVPRDHGGPPSYNLGVSTHLAWDFAEFDRHINALARGLLGMGVQKGDRVGVIMGNTRCDYLFLFIGLPLVIVGCSSAYAMLQWACASIGAILVTLNPAYRLTELVRFSILLGFTISNFSTVIGGYAPSCRCQAPICCSDSTIIHIRSDLG